MRSDPSKMRIAFHPATADRWKDVEKVLGERGGCGGCWCMFWRIPRKTWTEGKGAGNKSALKRVVVSGHVAPGILGYVGDEPIAWCAVASRVEYPALGRSRVLKPVDDKPVWSVSCLFVLKAYRRQGVSVRMLEAAAEFARSNGASIVEGYPVEPSSDHSPDPFIWTGTASAFRKAGFREVARRSATRPIMRREFDWRDRGHRS
jgi:GNAT superfamily N-acetyltransferase